MAAPVSMELLAPAGTPESFVAALAAGADAVYFGAPGFNARTPAREFSFAQIWAMREMTRRRGLRLFAAVNSLVKEEELGGLLRLFSFLAAIGVDGVILQDWGAVALARRFPALRLHASTLMNCHDGFGAAFLVRQGFVRIVLARELSLGEIAVIARKTTAELEVFVHGALCFSHSGLCLFSSYLGGKSGLRGRCVQPCRRQYIKSDRGGGTEGFFFSTGDLQAARLLPQLQEAGVRSLKIEGRLRSARYVEAVTAAYRLLLDSMATGKDFNHSIVQAEEMLDASMGRQPIHGFLSGRLGEVLLPAVSGNAGIFLGRAKRSGLKGREILSLTLRAPLASGDRLRLHLDASGDRHAFNAQSILQQGRPVSAAPGGARVDIACTVDIPVGADAAGMSVFKVDSDRQSGRHRSEMDEFAALLRDFRLPAEKMPTEFQRRREKVPSAADPSAGAGGKKERPAIWARIADFSMLRLLGAMRPQKVVVCLDARTRAQWRRGEGKGLLKAGALVWGLPPVLPPAEEEFYAQAVSELIAAGCLEWQVAAAGQISMLRTAAAGRSLRLYGHYTLNILNSEAALFFAAQGVERLQILVESDAANLAAVAAAVKKNAAGLSCGLGFTIYGVLPLCVSRAKIPTFKAREEVKSPRGEDFFVLSSVDRTLVLPHRRLDLLAELPRLATMGLSFVVVDCCHLPATDRDLSQALAILTRWQSGGHPEATRRRGGSSFNFFHGLE